LSGGPGRRRRGLVIAIDGPSGAGKSTAGRALADRLGYTFLDTGAMYRALALKALRAGIPQDREQPLAQLAHEARIEQLPERRVLLDGEDVTEAIRTPEVSAASSRISTHALVRREMAARQREMGRDGGVVLDGRDIGTAVFPDAEVKFYVDADPRRRAERRQQELTAAGADLDVDTIELAIRARDEADTTRQQSPLTRAPDAIHIDTTELDRNEVVEQMAAAVRRAASRTPPPLRGRG
jgi:cytidylate kinase